MAASQLNVAAYVEVPEVAAADSRKLLVMANLKAPTMKTDVERAPISISAVIDKSGSMEGFKLHLTKQTLQFIVSNLRETDEFGIVSYEDVVHETFTLSRMNVDGQRRAHSAIESLHTMGCTNLSGGLFGGIDQLKGVPVRADYCQEEAQPSEACQPSEPVQLLIGSEELPDGSAGLRNVFVRLDAAQANPSWTISEFVAFVTYDVPTEEGTGVQPVTVGQAPFELTCPRHGTAVVAHVQLVPAHGSVVHTVTINADCAEPGVNAGLTLLLDPVCAPQITTTPPSVVAAPQGGERNDVSVVWLFTDGQANRGITSSAELVQQTAARLQGMAPACSLFTFGVGEDHDAPLLKNLADAGKGMYYYIQGAESIAEVFADCLGGLLSVVTRDITVHAVAQPGHTIHRVLTKYQKEVTATSATITIPTMYSEEEKDLIFEVEVPQAATPDDAAAPILEFHVTYHNVEADQKDSASALALLRRPKDAQPCTIHPQLEMQRNRVMCAEAMEEARGLADTGNLLDARQKLAHVMDVVRGSSTAQDGFSVRLLEDVQTCLGQLRDHCSYTAGGSHTMTTTSACYTWQRSRAGGSHAYRTTYQHEMVGRAYNTNTAPPF